MSKGFTNSVVLTQDSPGPWRKRHRSFSHKIPSDGELYAQIYSIAQYLPYHRAQSKRSASTSTTASSRTRVQYAVFQSSIFGSGANKFEPMAELSAEDAEMLKTSELLGRIYFVPQI